MPRRGSMFLHAASLLALAVCVVAGTVAVDHARFDLIEGDGSGSDDSVLDRIDCGLVGLCALSGLAAAVLRMAATDRTEIGDLFAAPGRCGRCGHVRRDAGRPCPECGEQPAFPPLH